MKQLTMLAILLIAIFSIPCFAAILQNYPIDIVQPDGTHVQAFASGDEFYHPVEDANGYTILQHPDTGYYVYAEASGNGIKPSSFIVGKTNPEAQGIAPHLRQDPAIVVNKAEAFRNSREPGIERTNNTGTINNIVVFIRFSDQTEYPSSFSYNQFRALFDDDAAGAVSQRSYFLEASNNNLTIDSHLYPMAFNSNVYSYQANNPRSYYDPYNIITNPIGYQNDQQRQAREHYMLNACITWLNQTYQVSAGLNIDNDNDGKVDNVTFIVRGGASGWADLLWPHRWWLDTYTTMLNNKRVYDYTFLLEDTRAVGVISHEMSHTLGYPDLYHYVSNTIDLTGMWDLMSSAPAIPQYHLAYTDYKYGHWCLEPPLISTPGVYALAPRTSSRYAAYKIASTVPGQFYVVEYRKKTGLFESTIPGSGLLVYRVNSAYNGNASGPPDEIYMYRPNGTSTVNGTPFDANYSLDTGRTAIHENTTPKPFLADGITNGGLIITDISEAGDQISFRLRATAPKVWKGITSTAWNDASNWAGGIPTSADDVEIPANTVFKPKVNTHIAQCKDLKIDPNAYLTIGSNFTLTLSGSFYNYGKLHQENSSTLTIAGTMVWEAGSSVGTIAYISVINVSGDLIVKSGANVTFTNGLLNFRGAWNSEVYLYAPLKLREMTFYKTSGATVSINAASTADLTVIDNIEISSSNTLIINSAQVIHLGGNLQTNAAGNLYANAGTISLYGPANPSLNLGSAAGYFNNLKLYKDSMYSWISLSSAINIKGNLDASSGDLHPGSYQIRIGGNWTQTYGKLTAGTGTVVFNGTGNQTCPQATFNILELNKPSGSLLINNNAVVTVSKYRWISGSIDVNGTLAIQDLEQNGIYGTYNVSSSGWVNINQDASQRCDLNGYFNVSGGTINVTGFSDYYWAYAANAGISMSSGTIDWKNYGINVPQSAYTLALNISGGTLRTPGSLNENRADVHFDNGTLELCGSSYTGIYLASGSYLYNVTVTKTGSKNRDGELRTVGAFAASNLNLHGSLVVGSGVFDPLINTVTTYQDIIIMGTLQITNSGTLTSGDDFVWGANSTTNCTNGTINCYGNWQFMANSNAALDNVQVNLKADYGATLLCSSPGSRFGNLAIKGTLECPSFTIQAASTDSLLVMGTLILDPDNELDMNGKNARITGNVSIPATSVLTLSSTSYVYMQANLYLNGTLNVGTGTCVVHTDFYPAFNSLLQIAGGSFIQDALPSTEMTTTELIGGIRMTAGLLEVTNRDVIFGAHEIRTFGEGIVRTGGSFTANVVNAFRMDAGELQLTGRNAATLTCNNTNYINNLQLNKYRGLTVTLQSPIIVKGQLYIHSGKLVAGSNNITLGGNWYNPVATSRFAGGTATVVFNQVGGIQTVSGSTVFNNVTDSHIGNELQFVDACTINTLTVTNKVIFLNAMSINNLDNSIATANVEQHQNFTTTIANYSGGGTLRANPGVILINDLVDAGINGNYYATNGTISLQQDSANWCDLNGNLYISSNGIINISGGNMVADFAYSANASIVMDSGEVNFQTWGCRINATAYTLSTNITGGVIRSAGDFLCYIAGFNPASGTIEMTGANDANIYMASGSTFSTLKINKAARASEPAFVAINKDGSSTTITRANTAILNTPVTIRKDLQINAGVLNSANNNITIQGYWSNTVGTEAYMEISSTVTFSGSSTDTGILNSETFNYLILNNTSPNSDAFELSTGQAVTVTVNLTITDGTFEMNNNSSLLVGGNIIIASGAGLNANTDTGLNISVGGNWTDSNVTYTEIQGYNPGTSTLAFNGATDQTFTVSQAAFETYNLTIDKTGGRFIPTKTCKILGAGNLTRGEWYDNATGFSHEFYGNTSMSANSIWNGARNNTVKFKGGTNQTFFYDCRSSYLYHVTIDKTGGASVTLLNNVLALSAGNLLISAGILNLNHKYYRATGNVTINNTGKLSIDSDAWLELGSAKSLIVNTGGTLEAIGTAGHPAKITHQAGYYAFIVDNGGTLSAEYAVFEYVNVSGIYLRNGSVLDPEYSFAYCTFQNGAASGTLLRIDNSAYITIANAIFPTNTWSGGSNITKLLDQGTLTVSGASGGFNGSAFESDPYSRINWTGAMPDLSIIALTYNVVSPYIGDGATATVTVKNNGTVAILTPFRVDLYRNLSFPPLAGTSGDYFQIVNSLAAGGTADVYFYNIISPAAGTWNSYAYADGSAQVDESNEYNNASARAVLQWQALPAIADLSIQYIPQSEEVQLLWTYPMGVLRFNVYKDTDPYGSFETFAGSSLDPIFTEPATATRYYYRVTAERIIP